MPFDASNMAALIASDTTTLWFYRTTDSRAAVLAPGYFAPVAPQLQSGHVVLAQTSDSLAMLPVRVNGGVGNGLVLDVVGIPLARDAQASFAISGSFAAAAGFRTVQVDSPPAGLVMDDSFTIGASAGGNTASVLFRLLGPDGAVLATVPGVAVAEGRAEAGFAAPSAGTGYRIAVIDSDDSDALSTSESFASAPLLQMATEGGASLLTQADQPLVA
jgi:hypothetical protein